MKLKLGAVVPVMSYGNVQPEVEVEADTFEEALAIAEGQIRQVWDKYGEKPLPRQDNRQLLTAFVGGEIYYDEHTHTYTNEAGEVYLSGSVYADGFRKAFDKQAIAKLMADKIKADPADILAMWDLKSQTSMDFGNAIHKALQLYEQYNGLAEALNKTTHSHDHPVIKQAVDGFMDAHKEETAMSEVLVVDHQAKRAGRIDRLLIVDKTKKICRVQDYKTNADITKELAVYWHQLNFYGGILEAAGWKVQAPEIFHYDGKWSTYKQEQP